MVLIIYIYINHDTYNVICHCHLFTVQYSEKTRDETVSRKLSENRVEYQQLIIESILPPPQTVCSAAVQINSIIRYNHRLTV